MGAFYVNVHVKTDQPSAVESTVDGLGITERVITDPRNGWVTLLEQRCSMQDDGWIRQVGRELSSACKTATIAFLLHDSDFVCYWLHDRGNLIDQFNSMPDYFDPAGADDETLSGNPTALLPYVRDGVQKKEIEAAFESDSAFGDDLLVQIADLFGIDEERVLTDFRDVADDEYGNGDDEFDGDDDDGDGPRILGGPFGRSPDQNELINLVKDRMDQWSSRVPKGSDDPNAKRLVRASADGDESEIRRLVSEGTDVNVRAILPSTALRLSRELSGAAAGMMPDVALTPLMAAISNQHQRAIEVLLELGADVDYVDPLYGSAVHLAITAAAPEALKLVLQAGADATRTNPNGQTPMAVLGVMRQSVAKYQQMQSMLEMLGAGMGKTIANLLPKSLPLEAWDECEEILRRHL